MTSLERLTAYHTGFSSAKGTFGQDISAGLKAVEAEISPDGLQVKTVFETEVTLAHCNASGNAHGGCMCFLLDYCSSCNLLFVPDRWSYAGVSSNIFAVFHAAAPKGAIIRITSTILNVGKRFGNLRVEITDAKTGRLYVSGSHSKVDVVKTKMELGFTEAKAKL